MAQWSRCINGIPLWLLQTYLEEAGGRANGSGQVEGEGWDARLTQLDPYKVGSLSVCQVQVDLEGEEEALGALLAVMERKLLRAGG